MTNEQWTCIKRAINGETVHPLPVGFIIDSPWLPNWYGINILDYFTNDELWFKANMKAIDTFSDIIFLPGFWSEVGMCSEPAAFGARCTFPRNEFPHVHKSIHAIEDVDKITKPNCETDGFLPFVLNRLAMNQQKIEDAGHHIRFSISRGPLNIASYLMGTTEFLTNMMLYPEQIHKLLTIITDYLVEWHQLQKETFPTIDGIMVLDDILGFIGEREFVDFALPYLERIYISDVSVKFLHNDAQCGVTLKHLPKIGINMFNMGYDTSLKELKTQTDNKVVMLGNIPPRDVLAAGTKQDIVASVSDLMDDLDDTSRIIFSCGGGMPPGVSTANIRVFYDAVNTYAR